MVLDLNHNKIEYIPGENIDFKGFPKLKNLDISNNLLDTNNIEDKNIIN